MNTQTRETMNDLTRAFRNTAIILSMDSSSSEFVRINRAKDNYPIATAYRFWGDDGYCAYVVTMVESDNVYAFDNRNQVVRFIEADRHFPAKVEQCRSWSKAQYKDADFS